jgi:hypothetical protein
VRIVDLKKLFHDNRRLYASRGSLEERVMKRELARLASEHVTLPLPGDEEALRTPFETIWAHRLPDTNLVITYAIDLPTVVIHDVRPAWRTG